jgi:hypothetical protein
MTNSSYDTTRLRELIIGYEPAQCVYVVAKVGIADALRARTRAPRRSHAPQPRRDSRARALTWNDSRAMKEHKEGSMPHYATLYLRFALAAGFLTSVSDRFGLWGAPGRANVAWGDFQRFTRIRASWPAACFLASLHFA